MRGKGEEKTTRRSTEGRRREGRHKRGRLEKECAGGVRAAGMSHLISRVSDITSLFIEKGGRIYCGKVI